MIWLNHQAALHGELPAMAVVVALGGLAFALVAVKRGSSTPRGARMGGVQPANAPHEEEVAGEAEFVADRDARPLPSPCRGSRLLLGLRATLVAFACLTWVAVLLAVAGWLADLIWGRPPWSLLTYVGLALAASGAIGCWYGRRGQP